MSKSIKFKNNMFLDSTSIVHNKELLSNLLVGVGARCKEVSGDWNTACGERTGFYMGHALSNAPSRDTVSDWWYIIHLVHNSKFKKQIGFSFSAGNYQLYLRGQDNGYWTAWKSITFS